MKSRHFPLALKIALLSSVLLMLSACGDGYGSMQDPRDGHKYKTLDLFGYSVMVENMNYDIGDSRCRDDDISCEKYGRYYSPYSAPFVCPNGWKVFGDRDSYDILVLAYLSNKFDIPQDKNLKKKVRSMFSDDEAREKIGKAFVTEVFSNTSCVYDIKKQEFDCGDEVCNRNNPGECYHEYDGCLLVGEKVECWNIESLKGDGKGRSYAAPIRCFKDISKAAQDSLKTLLNSDD